MKKKQDSQNQILIPLACFLRLYCHFPYSCYLEFPHTQRHVIINNQQKSPKRGLGVIKNETKAAGYPHTCCPPCNNSHTEFECCERETSLLDCKHVPYRTHLLRCTDRLRHRVPGASFHSGTQEQKLMPKRKKKDSCITAGNRVRYFVNNLLSRNPFLQILVLFAISGIVIFLGMLLVEDLTPDTFWWSFTRLLDQGTFINDNYNPQIAVVGVAVTIGGILVLSLLIGIISSKITEQLDALKRGKSTVLEKDHYAENGPFLKKTTTLYAVTVTGFTKLQENSLRLMSIPEGKR